MKKLFTIALTALIAATMSPSALCVDQPVKREFRSAWVATVWRLDWPRTVISETGNEREIAQQKAELTRLLDSMQVNNMNAINFQVRSRSDAMYRSSYEPWSSDLVATRGMDPGWDPLEFCVEECHKRGLECHAWVNPYRYESVLNQWDGTPQAYREEHPDWLLDVGDASILNPGKPEVTQRICDVIAEIVTNYDIDGLLFDDYFYISGTTSSHDGDLYNAYKAEGGTLAIGDWRRKNVNDMVSAVYNTIKSIKPWVRFGISPAGIACTSSSVAQKYGVPRCPTGSDWQYASIFSDPLAWISSHSLDFISPQIYWTIGYSTDYDKACKWWSQIADKFGRHFYSSHSISSLTAASKAPGMSGAEDNISGIHTLASGPNNTSFAEYANEVRLNREYSLDGAPGSIFYSCKYMYYVAPLFAHYLHNTVFNSKALAPAMTWFQSTNPGMVQNLSRVGGKLVWDGYDNVRYTVYAVPESMPLDNFDRDPEYLLKVVYGTSFDIPQTMLSGYQFAVCVLDRFGNEYSATTPGAAAGQLDAPIVIAPTPGQTIEAPFYFEWQAVEGATSYIVEVAADREMTQWLGTATTSATTLLSDQIPGLPFNKEVYWRLHACGLNYNDGITEPMAVTIANLVIDQPIHGQEEADLAPLFVWSNPDAEATLQISTDEDFGPTYFVYEATDRGQHQIPAYRLSAYTNYYARLLYVHNGIDRISPTVHFVTRQAEIVPPGIAHPVSGGTLHCDEAIALQPVDGPSLLRIEVNSATSFSSRTNYITSNVPFDTWTDTKTAEEIRMANKPMVDGTTYYVRARASYRTPDGVVNSDYCEPVAFVYSAEPAGVADITLGSDDALSVDTADGALVITVAAATDGTLAVVSPSGAVVAAPATGRVAAGTYTVQLPAGIYIVTLGGHSVKAAIR